MVGGPGALTFVGAVWASAKDRGFLKSAAIIAALETAVVVAAMFVSVSRLLVG